MNNSDEIFLKFNEKFDGLNARITALQDIVLYMKNEFELLSKSKLENIGFGDLTDLAESNLNLFIDERPMNCSLLDPCTTLIEKALFKILKTYARKGANSAKKILDSYYSSIVNYKENGKCPNNRCIDKAFQIFDSIKNLIDSNSNKLLNHSEKVFSKINEINTKEGHEKEESKLIAPLSSEIRLKILKILSKGSTYYAQLERELNLRGGHFHFHLDKLIEADYVTQEKEKGPYFITIKGIKALQYLHDFSQEFINILQNNNLLKK